MNNDTNIIRKLTDFVQDVPEKVVLTALLFTAAYGYFHFGIDDPALILIMRIIFLLACIWIILVRSGGSAKGLYAKKDSDKKYEKSSDIETIQRLADHYQLQRRVDAEQDFRLYLTMILSAIKNTFVCHSAMAYLWDQEKNIFSLKGWCSEIEAINEGHNLSPDVFPVADIVNHRNTWIHNNGENSSLLFGCFETPVKIQSILAAPVLLANEVAGIIVLHCESKGAFGEDDKTLITKFCEIISKTILNYNNLFEFETSSRLFSTFYEISKELNSELKFNELLDFLVRIVKGIFEYDRIAVSMVDENTGVAEIVAVEGEENGFPKGTKFYLDDGLNGWVIRRNKPIIVSNLEKGDYFIPRYMRSEKSNYDYRSFLAAPIGFSGKTLGAISIENKKANMYVERHENILVLLCNNISMALERSLIYQKLESMATTDGLTGLYNYRTFRLRLNEELNRAHRYHTQFSLLIIDIDHFKKFNDTYGHLIGDQVLRNIAFHLKNSVRNIDFIARYGGEEFCAILLNASGDSARLSAERIRINIANKPLIHENKELPATVSIGAATYPEDADQEEDLISRADKALYRAKAEGRNRVLLYGNGLMS